MIIDCISDLHGHYPELEGGDLLIVAGDLTACDTENQMWQFHLWVESQKYKKKIVVAGNHDNLVQKDASIMEPFGKIFEYLCDSGTEFEGLKIWGSPWTKTFPGMNPHCKAFTFDTEEELQKKWGLIPYDVDILITHSPPWKIRDMTTRGEQVGSLTLMGQHLAHLRPKLWIFGHIHEAYGQDGNYSWNETKYVNCSYVNERYQPVNKPIRIEL